MPHLTEAEWAECRRQKIFAVAVLAEVWAPAQLPASLVEHAQNIRKEMQANGTWLPA